MWCLTMTAFVSGCAYKPAALSLNPGEADPPDGFESIEVRKPGSPARIALSVVAIGAMAGLFAGLMYMAGGAGDMPF